MIHSLSYKNQARQNKSRLTFAQYKDYLNYLLRISTARRTRTVESCPSRRSKKTVAEAKKKT